MKRSIFIKNTSAASAGILLSNHLFAIESVCESRSLHPFQFHIAIYPSIY